MKTKALLTLVAVLAIVASVSAQTMMMGRGGGILQLLGRNDVQKDLKMTPEQVEQVRKLRDEMRGEMRSIAEAGMGDMEGMREELRSLNESYDKKALGLLNDKQKPRVEEIRIQLDSYRSVLRADVQQKLGMTQDQKKQVKSIEAKQEETMRDRMSGMMGGGGPPDREAIMREMRELNEKFEKALEAVLDEKQKAMLKEMGGAPFQREERVR